MCTIFRLAKPGFFRYDENFTLGRDFYAAYFVIPEICTNNWQCKLKISMRWKKNNEITWEKVTINFLRGCSDHRDQLFCLFKLKSFSGLTDGVSVGKDLLGTLRVNPFLSRTVPWGGFARWEAGRANENREMTAVLSYVKQEAASALQKKMALFKNQLGQGLT